MFRSSIKRLTTSLVAAVAVTILLTTTAFGFRPIFHPPTVSILDALRNDEQNFSILIGLIRESGVEELMKEGKSFTLLAPTNAAFAKLPEGNLASLKKDKNKLRQLLFNHLLPGKILFKGTHTAEESGQPCGIPTTVFKTIAGISMNFQCVSPASGTPGQGGYTALINGKARVLEGDFEGKSAVIQVVDTVFLDDWEGSK